MEPGKLGVFVGLGASFIAVILYFAALRGNKKALLLARSVYGVAAVAVIFTFFRLMFLVTHKQYQYDYVFHYTSPDLQYPFLAAATWAGQEGSFLLWSLWAAVIGGLVAWKAGKWEARLMPIYVSSLCFLFGILVWLSPFKLLTHAAVPDYPADLPWPPQFGMGLNPSLQNYWMAIHPPTIFFGFASLLVPYSYAIAAMIWREYDNWAGRVMPWVLMTVATLGIGLFMGGYWAYETQGWHGFWGWDPVENASLFPWLGALGLLHGLIVAKSRGGMGRTSLFLAIISWMLFLYGTFLTRSGVLAETSVHAFDMIAKNALVLILVMIGAYGIGGLGLLMVRWRAIPGKPISDKALSRDTGMVLAVTLMVIACVVVCVGSSWPLISKMSMFKHLSFLPIDPEHPGALLPVFYNTVGSGLLIPTLLLMGAIPFLAWGKTNADKFLWKVLLPWFLSIGAGVLVLFFVWNRQHDWQSYLESDPRFPAIGTPAMLVVGIATLGAFAAFANIALAYKVLRSKAVTMGGWLAHVGIGLLFFGTVLTNVYETTLSYDLIEGDKPVKTPFGYSLQFARWSHEGMPKEQADKSWWEFGHGVEIAVRPTNGSSVVHADDGDTSTPVTHDEWVKKVESEGGFIAKAPVFYNAQLMMRQDPQSAKTMRWPYIHKELHRDFYILVPTDPKLERVHVTLGPGETAPLPVGKYQVHYNKFSMQGGPGQAGTKMGGDMELITPEGKKIPFRADFELGAEGPKGIATQIPEVNGAAIAMGGLDPASKMITVGFELPNMPATWVIPIAVTNKPWINLVWLGVVIMGLGTVIAMVRRALEARKGALIVTPVAAGAEDILLHPVEAEAVTNGSGNGHTNGRAKPRGLKAKDKLAAKP